MANPTVKLNDIEKAHYSYKEAINTLRTNIQLSGSHVKTIMFTSCFPNEGKSEITMSLAYSLAQIGKHVLLVDADIRKSVLVSRYLEGGQVDGLSQYLCGQRKLENVICHVENMNGFDILFAGPYSPNPAALLEEDLFGKVFEEMTPLYDYILVDTPPMADLIDGAIVARYCDGAVLVIESGAVSFRLEQKVKRQLEMAGCRILGAVLNKVDLKAQGYYGKYGKYGRYGKYARYGEEKEYDKTVK